MADLCTPLPSLPGSIPQKGQGVGNPEAVMQSKKEKLREFKFSWKLLQELPGTVEEEREHRGLRGESIWGSLHGSEEGTNYENWGPREQDTKEVRD